jgi:hypothetical protein
MIPRLYVQPWTQDMQNRPIIYYVKYLISFIFTLKLNLISVYIFKNAKKGKLATFEHNDALYLNKREQLKYNVQDRSQVDARYTLSSKEEMLNPIQSDTSRKHFSSLMARYPN